MTGARLPTSGRVVGSREVVPLGLLGLPIARITMAITVAVCTAGTCGGLTTSPCVGTSPSHICPCNRTRSHARTRIHTSRFPIRISVPVWN